MRKYQFMSDMVAPFLPLWMAIRRAKGKEDPKRMKERFGIASRPRPEGTLLWLHAASVGEANSVLLLIQKIRERFPAVHILLTTGTVTSAKLMQMRLPKGAIHQYAPVDTPKATWRFIRHWKPDIAFWVESELWPNLIITANAYECFMGIINARMSERSFKSWQKHKGMIGAMLSSFNVIFAQSDQDAKRLEALGAKDVLSYGNLKYDAALLPCDESALLWLKQSIGSRPVWLAASTHPGEEAMVAEAHKLLAATRPNLLTVIVPRHPERGPAIAAELGKSWRVALRSKRQPVAADTQIYVADTLGELGLFYRLCEIVFMGGSLVKHGGQNPLEPARLACGIVTGPHTANFAEIYEELQKFGGCARVTNAQGLAAQIDSLLNNRGKLDTMQGIIRQWIKSKGGAAVKLIDLLAPIFDPGKKAHEDPRLLAG